MKTRVPFPIVLAVFAFFLASSTAALATTRWVNNLSLTFSPPGTSCTDPGYPTIGAAVAAAVPGDTIRVCPGLYAEQVQVNVNNLTLLGAQAGFDARTRPFVPDPTTQSIIDHPCGPVQFMADDVELNGFTVQGSTAPDPCFLAGIWSNPGFSGTSGGFRILNNIVQNNISGIELDSNCNKITLVQFNLIQNNSNPGNGSGNGIQTNFGLCNATIDSNKFSGHTSSSILVLGPPASGVASNIDVTNNELVAPTPESISFLGVSNSTISGNVSTGSTNNATIDLFGGNSGVTVTGNTLLNGIRAIVVENPFVGFGVPQNSNIMAHQNCIQGNSVAGLEVDLFAYPTTPPPLNAQNNWWGSPSGPTNLNNPTGTGDRIIDPDNNVDFTPFLTTAPAGCPQVANTPGKATGGGKIASDPTGLDLVLELAVLLIKQSSNPMSVGAQATFGFVVTCCDPKGNLEYNDHEANVRIKATSFERLVISPSAVCLDGKHAQIKGQAQETTATGTHPVGFTVDVDDCTEPGSSPGVGPDMFMIQTIDYTAAGPLIGGNIQIKN